MANQYTGDLPDSFFTQWIDLFKGLGMNPIHPLAAAMNESNLSAKAHNAGGDAVGLIQFMPATLKGMGYNDGWQAFANLGPVGQLPYVKRYYAGHAADCKSAALCYVTTFLPALTQDAADQGPDYVLATDANHKSYISRGPRAPSGLKNDPLVFAYTGNPAFDTTKKGYITVRDLSAAIGRATGNSNRWKEILQRYYAAGGTGTPPDAQGNEDTGGSSGGSDSFSASLAGALGALSPTMQHKVVHSVEFGLVGIAAIAGGVFLAYKFGPKAYRAWIGKEEKAVEKKAERFKSDILDDLKGLRKEAKAEFSP